MRAGVIEMISPIVSGEESFFAGTASCRIRAENIDELYQRIQPLDTLHSNGQLKEQPWGDRDFSVLDLDNNLITLFEPLNINKQRKS